MDESTIFTSHDYVEGVLHQVRRLVSNVEQLQDELRQLAVTASSPDRLVSVTVGAQGTVRDLSLDPRIYRSTDAAKLSASIRTAIEQAQVEAQRREVEIKAKAMPQVEDVSRQAGLDLGEFVDPLRTALDRSAEPEAR